MTPNLPVIVERRRLPSPVGTPQALAWHQGGLWLGSRDERRVCGVDASDWTIFEEVAVPGIPWAAASTGETLYFTSGEGADDDRYLRRYLPRAGFDETYRVAVPEFTGSYLSCAAESFYLSQWYKGRVLQLDKDGNVVRAIDIGAEISGHTFVGSEFYVLRGTEQDGENWHIARLNLEETDPRVEDLARIPFACRSLAFDGTLFWTNHRAQNETVSFSMPAR